MVGGSDLNRSHFPMITYQAIALNRRSPANPGSLMRHNFCAMSRCLASDYSYQGLRSRNYSLHPGSKLHRSGPALYLDGDHPERLRCSKDEALSNRDHGKYLKDHLVLKLILNWTGKGNCAKAESGPETKFFFMYILKCSDSSDQRNFSSKKDQILLIAFSGVLSLSTCTTAKLENLHKTGTSQ